MASFVLQTLFEMIVTLKIRLNVNVVLADCCYNVTMKDFGQDLSPLFVFVQNHDPDVRKVDFL